MNRWAKKPPTAADAKGRLLAFLYSCRDHMLDAVTVEELTSRYRVSAKVAEYELTIARQKRAAA